MFLGQIVRSVYVRIFFAQLRPDCLSIICLKHLIFLPFPHVKYLLIDRYHRIMESQGLEGTSRYH